MRALRRRYGHGKGRKLKAVLPDGTVATRTSARPYTHVIAIKHADGEWTARQWTTNPAQALRSVQNFEQRHEDNLALRAESVRTGKGSGGRVYSAQEHAAQTEALHRDQEYMKTGRAVDFVAVPVSDA